MIWAGSTASTTKFCSPDDCSMQFGQLANERGLIEPAHDLKTVEPRINNLARMFVVQKAKVAISGKA